MPVRIDPAPKPVIPPGTTGGRVQAGGGIGPTGPGASPPSYVPSATNFYDSQRNVYNLKAANTSKTRAGFGRAMGTTAHPTHHLFLTDSLGAGCIQGFGTSSFDRLNAWPRQIAAELARHGISTNGTGWVRTIDANQGSDARWTFTGSWTGVYAYGFTTTGGNTATFHPNVGGTAYACWYYDIGGAGGATLGTIVIDGAGGASTRTLTSTTTAGWKRCTLIAASPMTSSSLIVHTANANGLYFAAGMVWTPGAGGLIASNLGQSGSRAGLMTPDGKESWSNYTVAQNGLGAVYQNMGAQSRTVTDAVLNGTTTMTSATANFTQNKDLGSPVIIAPGTAGTYLQPGTYISAVASSTSVTLSQAALLSGTALTAQIDIDPAAVHIELGGNDLSNGTASATVIAALSTIRAAHPNSDAFLYAANQPSSGLIANDTFDGYCGAQYGLADSLNLPLFDLRDRFGTYANQLANGLLGDSSVHMRAAAYADWGRNVGMALAN